MPPRDPDQRPRTSPAFADDAERPDGQRHQWMFDRLPFPAWLVDAVTLQFLDANQAAVREYGWSREEFLGMTIEQIRPPESLALLQQHLAELGGRRRGSVVTLHRTRDGKVRSVEVNTEQLTLEGREVRLVVVHDLTEWMTVQREARASEESYRTLVSQLTDVFFRTDTAGRWTMLTPSWEQLTGERPEDSIGKSFMEHVHPRDHARVLAVIPELVNGTLPEAALELRYVSADGGYKWVEARARRVVGLDGVTIGMAGTLHDVTKRLEARERARASEARFHAIFDRAAIGIVVGTLEGRVLEANDAYQSFVGYTEDELRQMPPSAYTPEEERPLEAEMLQRVAGGERRVVFEKRYLRKDGRVAWGQLTLSSVVDAEGVPQRIIGMVEDITARREAELSLTSEREFLRTLLDNLSDGIIACDANGIVTISNAVVRELGIVEGTPLGVDATSLGGRVFDAEGNALLGSEQMPLARALRGEVVRGEEMVVVPRGGRARTMLASALSFSNADGERLGAVLALHDITERKAAEVALQEASRSRSDFLARMSHELRTPLNSIIGFTNVLLRSTSLSDIEMRYLSRISANGRNLLQIINDLLDLTRIEAGRMPVALEPVDVQDVIAETIELFEPQLRDRAVRLVQDVPVATPAVPLHADAARLRQVLVNLVGNAVKFTEQGEVRVRLVTNEAGEPRCVEVSDTGIGIAPHRLDAIFEAFEQEEPTTTRRYGGTGLGLAISRSLCELMGFSLDARSEPGVGTTMTVNFAPDMPYPPAPG